MEYSIRILVSVFEDLILVQQVKNIILIFTGGVLWEIFEHIYGKNNATFISYFTDSHEKDYWWYGKISDIVVNNLGLFLGILFKKFNLQYIIYKLNGRISKI